MSAKIEKNDNCDSGAKNAGKESFCLKYEKSSEQKDYESELIQAVQPGATDVITCEAGDLGTG